MAQGQLLNPSSVFTLVPRNSPLGMSEGYGQLVPLNAAGSERPPDFKCSPVCHCSQFERSKQFPDTALRVTIAIKMVKMRKTKYNSHTSNPYYDVQRDGRIFRNPGSVFCHPEPRDSL